ncbi:MAG: L-seryl-tRNA(Sec) selenium transferase [candidate division Zixibacteria bacterium]|nr:L-seryl-tRNA(Sec) selenium transferase [candidate division Zixibacteria bacterium]NIR66261.1 L-seryl-tRNA(Sec) selenium transferase [candidate division Zixibacteria bacterium]NIS15074.1 L-seryl-tRNA(Sec) selenium transferase [candidate division Zixibacteria bacterium]NIS47863.1 L-seryl-tRNA(Sec) selenium transferase [candidate division Zixibacteria bacterium]NIT51589.1 L-seryl-tRNA(Sec) selenium transferase [candidate division Zixibacteria bacterium]
MEKSEIRTYKDIPQVEKILAYQELSGYIENYSKPLVTIVVRNAVENLRYQIKGGKTSDIEKFIKTIIRELDKIRFELTNKVVNATGIVVHTNLGRAPLGEKTFERLKEKVSGYSSLEFDVLKGERGSRGSYLFELLSAMTGAEAGIAVNNNAAAVMLILNTFGLNKKCIVSRGEQVQIGGGFRMPEVATRSGGNLVEVGTTNRTVIDDYRGAIDDETSILFKVHLSNFKLVGFTEETSLKELVALGKEKNLTVVHDLGSGAFVDTSQFGLTREPTIQDSLSAGVDLVCFSGDKLLGGPQAGIILGKKEKVAEVKKNPLYRTVRLDKIVIAILEELILSYMKSDYENIPAIALLSAENAELEKRAENIVDELKDVNSEIEIVATEAFCGGGSLPEESFPSVGIKIIDSKVTNLAKRLRMNDPPVIGRIKDDQLILDIRTIFPPEDKIVIEALKRALA